jgi:hypothetical protein
LTVNVHCAVRELASVAVHDTVVAPVENVAPDAGVHVVDTGCAPPVTDGAG